MREQTASECAARMSEEGVPAAKVETAYYADVCYVGQAHYLEIPLDLSDPARAIARLFDAFCLRYDQVYGHHTRNPARFVNLRVVQRAANAADGSFSGSGGKASRASADNGDRTGRAHLLTEALGKPACLFRSRRKLELLKLKIPPNQSFNAPLQPSERPTRRANHRFCITRS